MSTQDKIFELSLKYRQELMEQLGKSEDIEEFMPRTIPPPTQSDIMRDSLDLDLYLYREKITGLIYMRRHADLMIKFLQPLVDDVNNYYGHVKFLLWFRRTMRIDKILFVQKIIAPSFVGRYIGTMDPYNAITITYKRYERIIGLVIESAKRSKKFPSGQEIRKFYKQYWDEHILKKIPPVQLLPTFMQTQFKPLLKLNI